MQIYLLRHGIAEAGKPGAPDSERVLVPEGRKKLREVLKAARSAGVSPSLIVSSPYKRAVETAEIAAIALGYQAEIAQSAALVPDSMPHKVWAEIRTLQDQESILLAGHEPLFGLLFAYLLDAPSLLVDFKKGGLARIDIETFASQPRGVLRWFIIPKIA